MRIYKSFQLYSSIINVGMMESGNDIQMAAFEKSTEQRISLVYKSTWETAEDLSSTHGLDVKEMLYKTIENEIKRKVSRFRNAGTFTHGQQKCLNMEMELLSGVMHLHWDEKELNPQGVKIGDDITLIGSRGEIFTFMRVLNRSKNGDFTRIHAAQLI